MSAQHGIKYTTTIGAITEVILDYELDLLSLIRKRPVYSTHLI